MWLEDPVPPENIDAMQRVTQSIPIPVCTGENLYLRQGFRKLIEMQATSGVHIDVPKSGGLLESKKISDLADLYYIWTACHNPASPVGTIASCHAASAMREFRIHELANWVDWWPDLVAHEGPFWKDGYYTILAQAWGWESRTQSRRGAAHIWRSAKDLVGARTGDRLYVWFD